MESDKKVEIIQKVIRKLMEEEEEVNAKTPESFSALHEDDDNEKPIGGRRQRQLLSNLLSELESMEEKMNINVSEEETNAEDTVVCSEMMNTTKDEIDNEEIIKELKNIKRQNTITHCLVSAMIVLTLAWQLSEVSLILKIKDGLGNPLKSIGGIFLKNWRQVSNNNVQDVVIKQAVSEKQKQVVGLPGLKIPELPHLGLPGFDDN